MAGWRAEAMKQNTQYVGGVLMKEVPYLYCITGRYASSLYLTPPYADEAFSTY